MATTNADIDKRLSALEIDMALVKTEQGHLRELFSAKFDTLTHGLDTLSAKFDGLGSRIEQQASDPKASSAGRELLSKMSILEEESESRLEDHEDWRAVRRSWRLLAGGGLLMAVVNIVSLGRILGLW